MRSIGMILIRAFAVTPVLGQQEMAGPTNEKAQWFRTSTLATPQSRGS